MRELIGYEREGKQIWRDWGGAYGRNTRGESHRHRRMVAQRTAAVVERLDRDSAYGKVFHVARFN